MSKHNIRNISLLVILLLTLFSCQEKENQYVEGKKHGKWIEYLDSTFVKEVSQEKATYYRKIEYENGYPKGLVRDFFAKSNKIHGEEYLISGPYLKGVARPKDKSMGIKKWFDEKTGKIKGWFYHDNFGQPDLKKYYVTGIDEIKEDDRFDETFYWSEVEDKTIITKLFKLFNKNPEFFSQKEDEIRLRIHSNDEANALVEIGEKENLPILSALITYGLEALVNNNEEQAVNPSPEENYEDSYTENTQQSDNYQPEKRECNYCEGSCKCSTCSKVFTISYYNGNGFKNRNETRTGYVMCTDCHGAGVLYKRSSDFGKWEVERECYVSSCIDGWNFCRECNNSGNGQNLGQCKECRGTGFRN